MIAEYFLQGSELRLARAVSGRDKVELVLDPHVHILLGGLHQIQKPDPEVERIATVLPSGGRPFRNRVVLSVYFKPSFFPAAISAIDSRMRLARVSGRLAV